MAYRYTEDVHVALVEEMVIDVDGINCSLTLLLVAKNLGRNSNKSCKGRQQMSALSIRITKKLPNRSRNEDFAKHSRIREPLGAFG